MARDENGELRLLMESERKALRVARNACSRAGYVRAAEYLNKALSRDSSERGPKLETLAYRVRQHLKGNQP